MIRRIGKIKHFVVVSYSENRKKKEKKRKNFVVGFKNIEVFEKISRQWLENVILWFGLRIFVFWEQSKRLMRWSVSPQIFLSHTMLLILTVFRHTPMAAGWIFLRVFPSTLISCFLEYHWILTYNEYSNSCLCRKITITHYCDLFDIYKNCHRQHHSKKNQCTCYYVTVFAFDRECSE